MTNTLMLLTGAAKPRREAGFIRAQGRDFVDEAGQPWPFIGYTMHYLPNHMWPVAARPDYHPADFDRLLDEPIELGFNTIITVGLHASPWKTEHGWRCTPYEHPDYFQKLAEMFDRCAARGIRVAHAIFADVQEMPKGFDAQWFFQESCKVMRGRWNVFARTGNEWPHNGYYPLDYTFPDMQGVLCSHGSHGGERNPIKPFLDFEEYELRRDLPKMFVDAPLRQLQDGDYEGSDGKPIERPLVSIEPIVFNDTNPDEVGDDDRSTDPRVALELAILTACCAGGGFLASLAFECKKLGPIARQCAVEYVRGLRGAYLRPLAALDFKGHH